MSECKKQIAEYKKEAKTHVRELASLLATIESLNSRISELSRENEMIDGQLKISQKHNEFLANTTEQMIEVAKKNRIDAQFSRVLSESSMNSHIKKE